MTDTPEQQSGADLTREPQSAPDNAWLRDILLSPAVQEFFTKVSGLIEINIKTKANTTKWATASLLAWTAVLAAIVIVPATLLAWTGKISSDAATFLFGTVVGAAFTFLRSFFSKGG